MEFLRAIGPVFNFLLLAGALFFLTRKRIRKLFRDRTERIAEALGRAADAQDQARHTAEDIAEAQQTADAQASRGARVTGGPLGGVRMLGSVAIPLFTGVFRHAETLSAAMDARCYHGEQGRTRLHTLAFGRRDVLAAVVTALLLACVIVINLQLV